MTGTFAGVIPVNRVDGREISEGRPMVEKLQALYAAHVRDDLAKTR